MLWDDWHTSQLARLSDWSAAQQQLFGLQQQQFNKVSAGLFGYFCLIESLTENHGFAALAKQQNCIQVALPWSSQSNAGFERLYAAPESLPFADNAIDLVVVHHLLESSAQPHQIIREAVRVVMPQGKLVIFGSNPLSLEGIVCRGRRLCNRSWRRQMPTVARIIDWLRLLEMNDIEVSYQFPRLQSLRACTRQYRHLYRLSNSVANGRYLPLAGSWCLVATKYNLVQLTYPPAQVPAFPRLGVQVAKRGRLSANE